MGTITLTNTLSNGSTADADEVMENFTDIVNECNGSLDADNLDLSNAGAIGGTTPAAGAFTTLASSGAYTNTVADGTTPMVITSTTVVDKLNVDEVDGYDMSSGMADKTRTIAFTAAGAIPATTNGANQNKIAGTNFEYYQLEFDKDTDESVFWIFPVPDQYDGGNVKFDVISKCATVTSGTVLWVIKTGDVADSATWDAALGTTITFDAKTVDGTALDIFTATKTSDPGWTAGRIAILKLYRDVSGDSAAEDVDVVAVNAYWEVT